MTKNIIKLFCLTLLINGSIAIASEREMQIYATVKTRPIEVLAMLRDAQDLELAIRAATQHNVPLAKELLNHSSLKLSQEQIKEGAICAACVNDDVELFNILFSRLEAQYRMECVNRALDRAAYNEHPAMVQHLVTRKDIIPTDMAKVLAEYKNSREKDLLDPNSDAFNEQKYSAEFIAANKEAAVKARVVFGYTSNCGGLKININFKM